ncbi:hypothetical protein HYW54_00335, partial [Candidatus Gottesmanbacteria bacterium]|nr:hypothetical protein [Candidatus Gottesmanbacteria bacterium]
MQFLVIGKDGKDKKAKQRRIAARQAHLALGDKMEEEGTRWYGAVLMDEKNNMIGSMAVMDFPSEEKLQEWLKKEPYVTGKVWKTVEVIKCNVKNPWKFNRPQSFF